MGLTGFTTRAHIVRALLEAICFQSLEVLNAMRRDADLHAMACLRVDGGASKNGLLMQLQVRLVVCVGRGGAWAIKLHVGQWEGAPGGGYL